MAIQFMRFQYSAFSLNISELQSDNKVLVNMYGNGNACNVFLDEANLIELRKWTSRQIKKISKSKQTK